MRLNVHGGVPRFQEAAPKLGWGISLGLPTVLVIRHGKQFYCCHIGKSTIFKQINVVGMLWGRRNLAYHVFMKRGHYFMYRILHEVRRIFAISVGLHEVKRNKFGLFLGYVPRSPRATVWDTNCTLATRRRKSIGGRNGTFQFQIIICMFWWRNILCPAHVVPHQSETVNFFQYFFHCSCIVLACFACLSMAKRNGTISSHRNDNTMELLYWNFTQVFHTQAYKWLHWLPRRYHQY